MSGRGVERASYMLSLVSGLRCSLGVGRVVDLCLCYRNMLTGLGTSVSSRVLSEVLKLKWEVKVNDKCAASPLLCPVLLNLLGSS